MAIHRSLGRLCGVGRRWWSLHLEWDKIFGAGAILFIGGSIGGSLGLIPFLDADPTNVARREYIGLLAVGFFVGIGCAVARMAVKQQQVESIDSVYESVDDILKGYESPGPGSTTETDAKP